MSVEVRLPKLSQSMEEGLIVEWLAAEGERVAEGEPLLQIETDKAVEELECPASGVLTRILQAKGARVPVDEILAIIETSQKPSLTLSSQQKRRP